MFNPKDPELKVKMVIYQIRNLKNNKSYIGQSTKGFYRRYSNGNAWWKPLDQKVTHLSNAVAKYGLENFEVRILEKNVESIEELNRLEIMYIQKFNTKAPNGYNYHPGGTNTNNWNRSIDSRDRMALVQSGGKTHRLLNNRTGIVHEFVNIQRFADENELSGPMLTVLLSRKGSRKKHREWSLPENPIRKTRLLSPEGVEHVILQGEMKAFCRKQKFPCSAGLFAVLAGRSKSTYGWTVAP